MLRWGLASRVALRRERRRSRPPRDRPWYHLLVHGADHTTYVAERHLSLEDDPASVEHPQLGRYFDSFEDGRYRRSRQLN